MAGDNFSLQMEEHQWKMILNRAGVCTNCTGDRIYSWDFSNIIYSSY